ncbi:MAG: stringent starvation protein B [Candidatus Azotimanducaceae bacterium]
MKARRPYLLRALYDWILDSDEVPNILVDTESDDVIVPREFVQDGQIVLNISPEAVRGLSITDDFLMCEGRFSGRSFEVILPMQSIRAIYCRGSGQGLAFEDEDYPIEIESENITAFKPVGPSDIEDDEPPAPKGGPSKPSLRLV